jgi:hypothetical protein
VGSRLQRNYDLTFTSVAAQGGGYPVESLLVGASGLISDGDHRGHHPDPAFQVRDSPVGLKAVIRFVLAVMVVAGSILIVTYGLLAVGHYLR